MKNYSIKYKGKKYIEIMQNIFFACILTVNCIRVMNISIYDSAILMPILFMGLLGTSILLYGSKIVVVKKNNIMFIIIGIYIVLSNLLYVIQDFSIASEWIKFVLCIISAIVVSKMSFNQIKRSILIFMCITLVFSIYAFINVDIITSQMLKFNDLNYLVVTLPIGCVSSISLVLILYDKNLKNKIIYGIITIFLYISMFQYAGRGNVIIPIIVLLIIGISKSIKSPKNALKMCLMCIILYFIIISIFENYTSDYIKSRFIRLFLDYSSESRVDIYLEYIGYIFSDYRWFFGIGFKQSVKVLGFYPHNFMLELFGENGVIGALSNIMIVVLIITNLKKILKMLSKLKDKNENIYYDFNKYILICVSMLLYYFITFFKSFSIYDAYQLFMSIGIIVAVKNELLMLLGGELKCQKF